MKVLLPDGTVIYGRWKYTVVASHTAQGTPIGITEKTEFFAENAAAKTTLGTANVKRYHLDPIDKDAARKFSMLKFLDQMYPLARVQFGQSVMQYSPEQKLEIVRAVKQRNQPNKAIRRLFWEAYIHRNDKFEAQPMVF